MAGSPLTTVLTGIGWVVLPCWLVVEVVFWVYIRWWVHPRISALRKPAPSPRTPKGTVNVLVDTLDMMKDHYCSRRFLSGWFNGASVEEIKKENFRELMAWAIFASRVEDVSEAELRVIDEAVAHTIEKFKLPLESGYNPKVQACRMTLESLTYIHRPFSYYLSIYFVQALGNLMLSLFGFRRMEHQGQVYWYREGPKESEQLPLLFFHGISLGLAQYLTFALPLSKGRTALLFEAPHISMNIHAIDPPTRIQTLEAIENICKIHGLDSGVMAVGHSFGSIVTGWLATAKPKLVAQAVFVDPVCFLLCLPDVCYNFLYRRPKTLIEYAIYYLFASETTINNALQRHFWWYENICLLEEIHCPVVIALSGNDEVAPADTVRAYVEHATRIKAQHHPQGEAVAKGSVDLIWWQDSSHAECLVSKAAMGDLLAATHRQQERLGIKPGKSALTNYTGTSPANTVYHAHSSTASAAQKRRLSKDYHED